jgi:hypothetical protein
MIWICFFFSVFYSFPELVDRFDVFFLMDFFFVFGIFFLLFSWGTMLRAFKEKKKGNIGRRKKLYLIDQFSFSLSLFMYSDFFFFSFFFCMFYLHKRRVLCTISLSRSLLCACCISLFLCVCIVLPDEMTKKGNDNA